MNFQNLNFNHVEPSRRWPPQFHTAETFPSDSDSTIQAPPRSRFNPQYDQDSQSSFQSITPQPTTAPPAPSPPSPPDSSSEIYGPDRHRAYQAPPTTTHTYHANRAQPATTPVVHFDESQLALFAIQNANPMPGMKDALTIAAGKVTPGVDDTPYIQYALEALVRDRGTPVSDGVPWDEGYTPPEQYSPEPVGRRRIPDEEMALGQAPVAMPQATYAGLSDIRRPGSSENARPSQQAEEAEPRSTIPPQPQPTQQPGPVRTSRPAEADNWVPVTKKMRENFYMNDKANPPLTYKPRMIRPFSMIIFMMLCIFMIIALAYSTVYSDQNDGLADYPGTRYSGTYFLFRILPQLLAAVIFMYSQSIVATSFRILPFLAMANDEDARKRYLALFQRLHADSFFWPRLVGPWQVRVFSVASWLAIFTVPLASSVFTCIWVEGQWIWAPVQGVAWALVVLYIVLVASAAALMVFWFGQWTGLMWDVRSIADLIPLLNRSNATGSYRGKELTESGSVLKAQLRDRWFDRLGYWRSEDAQMSGTWYGIGASGSTAGDQDPKVIHEMMGGKRASYDPSLESHDPVATAPTSISAVRYRYLPWCLRNGPLILFSALACALLLTLLIVSFLPQTRLEDGFRPLLSAKPGDAAFSAANFLYSFLPSLLGMVLLLLLQKLDLALRIVQPWGELSRNDGSPARRSILADYAACLPLQVSWRAARAGHLRVAAVSLMTTVGAPAIPALAGGLFMALTKADGQVRMFPNVPVYGVLLALLFLYTGCLMLLIPRRRQFRLPHAVDCLAEIISFCSAEGVTQDAAFRAVRSRGDLEMRLGAFRGSDPREESSWYFGVLPGKNEKRLSVRRMRRFTEKTRRSTRSMV